MPGKRQTPMYKRVLIKISGESFCSPGESGIDSESVQKLVSQILPVTRMGVQIALVVGGGNIVRGRRLADSQYIQRATADYMGMLGTVINAIALQDALENKGARTSVLSAIPMVGICEPFARREAIRHLKEGTVVILAAGTGNPFFTTDTCAALRANELDAQALLKATKVDGVFDSDPMVNPRARKYDRLTYHQAITERLGVMDLTAISMCMESKMPIVVFKLSKPGNLTRAVRGEAVGTTISD